MALPSTLNPARPLGTDSVNDPASSIDNQIRDLKQLVADLLGIPVDPTSLTAAWLSGTAGGVVSVVQPATHRIAGFLDRTATNINPAATGEVTIYTFSVPANALGTVGRLKLTLYGTVDGAANADTWTLRFKYGATTLITMVYTNSDLNTAAQPFILEYHLMADTGTALQLGFSKVIVEAPVTATEETRLGRGTAAIDSTQAQTFLVSSQTTNATVNPIIVVEYAALEYVP